MYNMPIKEQGDPVLLFLLQGGSMGKNYGLTDTEAEIMELLWQSEEPLPFKAIMEVEIGRASCRERV